MFREQYQCLRLEIGEAKNTQWQSTARVQGYVFTIFSDPLKLELILKKIPSICLDKTKPTPQLSLNPETQKQVQREKK